MRIVLASIAVALGAPLALAAASASGAEPKFVERVDNPWFPLRPGTVYVYRGVEDGRASRDVVTVTKRTRTIEGVRATVVTDNLYLGGKLAERTTDWYAQDRHGNVWYLGEATAELDRNGRVKSREGSWLNGRDGATAGILMPAHPAVGDTGRQEHYRGHADDRFAVLDVDTPVTTPFVSSSHALLTKEWTPLEPGVVDHKYYVRGIGNVREEMVKGGEERAVLVSVRHARS